MHVLKENDTCQPFLSTILILHSIDSRRAGVHSATVLREETGTPQTCMARERNILDSETRTLTLDTAGSTNKQEEERMGGKGSRQSSSRDHEKSK